MDFVLDIVLLLTELFLLFLALGFLMAIVFYVLIARKPGIRCVETFPYWRAFVMCLRNWASFSGNIFSPWIERNCRLIALSARGFIVPQRVQIPRLRLAPPGTSNDPGLLCL